jgi:hypothetical protein
LEEIEGEKNFHESKAYLWTRARKSSLDPYHPFFWACKVKKTRTALVEFKRKKKTCKKSKLRRDIAMTSITLTLVLLFVFSC